MTRKFLLLPLLLSLTQFAFTQSFSITGRITTNKLEPLALVSIQVKDAQTGTISRDDGTYKLELDEGIYDVVFTMLGFRSQVIHLVVNKNLIQNIILEPDESQSLSEVVVKGRIRDRSEEIIRNVIRHKEALLSAAGPYSCTVYIKAVQEDSGSVYKKKKNARPDSIENKFRDLQQMSIAEIALRFDHANDQQLKEERTGYEKRGNPEGLYYLSMTDGNFNLYNNLIKAPTLSPVPFLSPVSSSGLLAYRYKLLRIKQDGNRKIYVISVRPRQLSNVTVEGTLSILDNTWVILDAHFTLPAVHLPEYDHFEVAQDYSLVSETAWMITRQQFTYYSRHGKGKLSGQTTLSYSDFEFNKSFPNKYFGNEVSATAQEAYDRDSLFWQKERTEPLTPKEIRFIRYKDSIYHVTNSKAYLDSIDSITNRVTWKKLLLTGQTNYNRAKERSWSFMPVTAVYELFQFGGARLNAYANYERIFPSKRRLSVYGDLSYGFRNHDLNGNFRVAKMYNPFTQAFYRFEVKREFDYIFQGDAWINMIRRNNFYLNNSISVGHGGEIANGLFLFTDLDLALRRSLSNYKTNDKIDSLFGSYLDDNQAVAFEPYNAVYGKIRLQYTPGQKYIREPKEKIILGSKWPTFYVLWRKGIPGILNSKVDFDYLEFGIEQQLKLGTTGVSHYSFRTGDFLNTKDLRLVDYKFQRRGDPIFFMNPDEAFQSLDSTFPVFHRFYQAHYVHEFNGAIINKIPFLKKLRLKEIAGGGFLVAPERNLRYGELFAGVERVFKWPFNPLFKFKMGVYIIGSGSNQFRSPIQFKIGFTSWDRRRNKWI